MKKHLINTKNTDIINLEETRQPITKNIYTYRKR